MTDAVPEPTPRYELQRYDSSWGGFRAMPTSFYDDAPARFPTLGEASAALEAVQERSASSSFRLRDLESGKLISGSRRGARPPR